MTISSGLSYDKPLWEIHLLLVHNCLVFRIHHALGDGVSLMSMLLACCRRIDGEEGLPRIPSFENKKSNSSSCGCGGSWWKLYLYYLSVLWGFVKMGLLSLVFVVEFVLRALWVRDRETVISGGEGVELWPRKLATARRIDGEEGLPRIPSFENKKSNSSSCGCGGSWWKLYLYYLSVLWGFVKMGLLSLVFVVEFVLRALWVRDRETVISGGEGVELWPRKLATARFSIQDMKVVKKAVPNA
ncbi:o-acyltransferase wsd1, partial [Quercus suber]